MAKLSELAEILEKVGRLYARAGKILREAEIGPLLEEPEEKEKKIPLEVQEVWDKYCEARAQFYRDKHRLSSTHLVTPPALTPKRIKLIHDAVKRHDVERVKRAAIGLFLSEFHIGKNEHGKAYVDPERPFQIKGDKDMVDYFADVYVEVHGEY